MELYKVYTLSCYALSNFAVPVTFWGFVMKLFRSMLLLSLLVPGVAYAQASPDTEIRFYPQKKLWTYQLETARGLNSAVLQNTAIINHGSADQVIGQVRFELMRGGDAILSRTLYPTDLDKAAKGANALASAGLMDLLAFQFSTQTLFGGKPVVSATRTLAPGASLYLAAQSFTFPGRPESLRVTVDFEGDAADAVTTLPLQYGSAPGKFRLPLRGIWVAGAGSTLHSHHRWAVPEEFAFDFSRYGASGMTYQGDGTKPEDYYAYGQPVSATADGQVIIAKDGMPDSVSAMRRAGETLSAYQVRLRENQGELLAQGIEVIPGNHVVIRHADNVFSVYGHLKPDSIKVKVGEMVKAGQGIAAVGTSGNSTEPHLHFHICDAPSALVCAGMPVEFYDVEIPISESPRQIQSGDLLTPIPAQ